MPDLSIGNGQMVFQTVSNSLSGLHIQSSAYGNPLTILHGRNRVTAQLIYLTDFTATNSSTTQGGKGGGGGQTTTTTTYNAAIAMFLCEGPLTYDGNSAHSFNGVYKGWRNRAVLTLARLENNWSSFKGDIPQTPWSYTTSHHPGEDVPYSGFAYMAHAGAQLDDQGGVQTHSFEAQGLNSHFVADGVYDCSPLDSIYDFLTNPTCGADFPYMDRDPLVYQANSSKSTVGQYWMALGLFISPIFDTQQTARDHMTGIMDCLNAEFIWSENRLKMKPYGDVDLSYTMPTGGDVYSYANDSITPVYTVAASDLLPMEKPDRAGAGPAKDPITIKRVSFTDPPNVVRLEFLNRLNQYSPEPAEARDLDDIQATGQRVGNTIQAHFITDPNMARLLAQLILQKGLCIRNTYKFMLDLRFCLLEPMDVIALESPTLNSSFMFMRVKSIDESETGVLTVEAEEIPTGIGTAVAYGTQTSGGYSPDTEADPGNTNAPVMFQPPVAASGGKRQLWIVGSGGTNWGGANIWASKDGVNYAYVGQLERGRHGVLTTNLAAAPAGTDSTNTLSVDLTASSGMLISGSSDDMASLNTACYVDGELLAYQNATLTSSYHYNLAPLNRGAYGSASGDHLSGTKFARLDAGVFKFDIPSSYDGATVDFKFQSFNVFSANAQDLSACTAYPVTIDVPVVVRAIVASPSNSSGVATVTDKVVTVDLSGGPYYLTLPAAVSGVSPGSVLITIKGLPLPTGSPLTNAITVAPPSGGKIDGYNEVLVAAGSSITVQFDGTNYWVIASTGTGYTATGFGDGFGDNFGGNF